MPRIYLDHNASTAVRPEVLEAMLPYFSEHFGNASSVHAFGQEAKGAMEDARAQVASLLNATPGEIVFTGGGTESDNIGVIGGARALPFKGRHVVVSLIEHDAVRHAADALEREGYTVTRVAPDARGVVDPGSIAAAIRPDTALVSVMAANNENGVIQPVEQIGAVCAERGVAFHVDAVQAAGKIPIDVQAWQATMATIAGHKFYAPKGVGALFVKRGFKVVTLQYGGEHEKGRRPGTENVPAIVGLGKASELALRELTEGAPRVAERPARGGNHGARAERDPPRGRRTARPEHRPPFVRWRGRGASDPVARHEGDRGIERGRLQGGLLASIARTIGHGGLARDRAVSGPLQPGPMYHGGRDRPSARDPARRRLQAPRHLPRSRLLIPR